MKELKAELKQIMSLTFQVRLKQMFTFLELVFLISFNQYLEYTK
jgi:hypothetical protein